jgi:lysyl-tRNA synthetase class I
MFAVCPICNRTVSGSIEYVAGTPTVVYRCHCGYDSSFVRTVASTYTLPFKYAGTSNNIEVYDEKQK